MSNIPLTKGSSRPIFLFGPTGVGKTALLEQLFASGYEVVNADSKQIYRHLDIGSAKPESDLLGAHPPSSDRHQGSLGILFGR